LSKGLKIGKRNGFFFNLTKPNPTTAMKCRWFFANTDRLTANGSMWVHQLKKLGVFNNTKPHTDEQTLFYPYHFLIV